MGARLERDAGSYRDPSGFVYRRDGVVLRQIDASFAADWTRFNECGLYADLVTRGMLVPHEERPLTDAFDGSAWSVIRPQHVDFVSYPYEWTFGELKDAALLTLEAELAALDAGMMLRDASAFNVQFQGVHPVLIDSLSFARAEPGSPWLAYRQFCEHFLAPLALMAERDIRTVRLMRGPEGVPIDLAARLLPGRTRLRLGLGAHLHLHSRAQRQHATDEATVRPTSLPTSRLRALVQSLRSTVESLRWHPIGTEWADYADSTSYGDEATAAKTRLVGQMLGEAGGRVVWDLGANTGRYSAIASGLGRRVVAFDADPAAAERHYASLRSDGRTDTTPLVMDLADPSPQLGWAGRERRSLAERADADVLLALALVHHLAIGRNVPLAMVLGWFAELAPQLIVEWVPRDDAMVRRLLAARRDRLDGYSEEAFQAALEERWSVVERAPITGSARVLYHLRRREPELRHGRASAAEDPSERSRREVVMEAVAG